MHYKNGRPAQQGDRIIRITPNGEVTSGIAYNLEPRASTCNARVAQPSNGDPYVTLHECLHIDDAKEALNHTQIEPTGPLP